MRAEYRERWSADAQAYGSDLKTPRDLLRRPMSTEDYVDTVLIGGVSVADIIDGKVSESQIPAEVKEAFHEQYPHRPGFVEAVQKHAGDPEAIRSIISNVKGKLFEINYVEYLNDGHLPPGYTAELALKPNQSDWDIKVYDSHGHEVELLQLKASASVSYIRDAIHDNSEIPVVVPHDAYDALINQPDLAPHLIDGAPQTLDGLTQHVTDASDSVYTGIDYFHVPELAIAFAAIQNYRAYRQGRVSLDEALGNFGARSVLATIASGLGWAAAAASHSTGVGIPVAMVARLFGSQFMHNRDRRKTLDQLISNVQNSRERLERQVSKPVMRLALPSS